MLSVILGILKVIGIVLLVIIGFFLTVILLILFVPVRYECSASGEYAKEAEGLPEVSIKARVSWMFRAVSVRIYAEREDIRVRIRFFGVLLGGRDKGQQTGNSSRERREKNRKEKKKYQKKAGTEQQEEVSGMIPKEQRLLIAQSEKQQESHVQKEEVNTEYKAADVSGESSEVLEDDDSRPFWKKLFLKLKKVIAGLVNLFRRIKGFLLGFFHNLGCTFEKICDKIKKISSMAEEIKGFLYAEENRKAFRYVKGKAGKLFRHIFPTKFSGRLTFSLENPAATGRALMALGIAYPLIKDRILINPLFENRMYFEGSLYVKGRIRVWSLLIIGIQVWFSKELRGFLKRGRSLKEHLSQA